MTDKFRHNRSRISRVVTAAFAWGLAIVPAMLATPSAEAQTFKLLYTFTGGADGGGPWGTPLLNGGILYESTYAGGSNQAGTVFEFVVSTLTGTYLHSFTGQPYDGSAPMGGLATDGFGDLYGTTTQGGFNLRGTLYQIYGSTETEFSFNGADGETPEGDLFAAPNGTIYGTTTTGGANSSGTLFSFVGSINQLYSFGNHPGDGIAPASSVVLYKGSAYGTTTEGGAFGWGTVYSLNLRTKAETVLYSFRGGPRGGTPVGGLASDGKGNLYGTASAGGSTGNGVAFKLNIAIKRYIVLHTFADPMVRSL